MPTGSELLSIMNAIRPTPWWLGLDEEIQFHESRILYGTQRDTNVWRFIARLASKDIDVSRKETAWVIPAEILKAPFKQRQAVLDCLRPVILDAIASLRPTELPPHVLQIGLLAFKAIEDESAQYPLGDLIIETQWYDERVIRRLWQKSDAAIDERELWFHLAADCQDPKLGKMRTGPWANMKREWVKGIAGILTFGEWPSPRYFIGVQPHHWPVCARQWIRPSIARTYSVEWPLQTSSDDYDDYPDDYGP